MKVYAQIVVSRDGYVAGVGNDISWISEKTREQYARTIHGMGNCIIGRRAYQSLQRVKNPDYRIQTTASCHCEELETTKQSRNNKCGFKHTQICSPQGVLGSEVFVTILSRHNYPSQPNRHFTHAKPKNILKLLDEKGYSSTVVCGGVEIVKLFVDAGVVDRLIVYREDVDVGEGVKFPEELLEGWEYVQEGKNGTIYQRG